MSMLTVLYVRGVKQLFLFSMLIQQIPQSVLMQTRVLSEFWFSCLVGNVLLSYLQQIIAILMIYRKRFPVLIFVTKFKRGN